MPFIFISIKKTIPQQKIFAVDTADLFKLRTVDKTIFVDLKKRTAYPGTFCRRVDQNTFEFGYGKKEAAQEFLQCTVDTKGKFEILRDAFGTLPLFYADTQDELIVCNDYATITNYVPDNVSKEGVIESLAVISPMINTYNSVIKVLWPDEYLALENSIITVSRLHERQWRESLDAPRQKPQAFYRVFEDYLDYFIETRLTGQQIAFEVSGGLDSATLPQYLARSQRKEIITTSLIHQKEMGRQQKQKLSMLSDQINAENIHISINFDDFPLSRMIKKNNFWPTYFEKTYLELHQRYIKKLVDRNITVLCTGVGADELFSNTFYDDYNVYEFPKFVTEKLKNAYRDIFGKTKPLRRRAPPVDHHTLCNNVYIEWGIWPVSPFEEPELFTWIQGLPAQFRINKNILRAYHQANQFTPTIYTPNNNEDFTYFFNNSFKKGLYDNVVKRFAANSATAQMNYVDVEQLLRTYETAIKTDDSQSDRDLFHIYFWLLTEINLIQFK